MNLYLDNAATSFPKPKGVAKAVYDYMTNIGVNTGRGTYSSSLEGSRIIFSARESISSFFYFDKPSNVIFTPNITFSLNLLVKGFIDNDFHVITTSMDHNSVLRPLYSLKDKKIDLTIVHCSKQGLVSIEDIKSAIKNNTKLIVMSISSNIVGTIQPIKEIGILCKKNNIFFVLDTAQGAGHIPIDFYDLNLSALAFTGHKGLLGPQGTGGFIISDEMNDIMNTYIEGGTGSESSNLVQPNFLPDKFESGTMNNPGIYGLKKALDYINDMGISYIREKEIFLTNFFIQELLNIENIFIYGPLDSNKITPVISITSDLILPDELSFRLDREFNIMTRCGLHCAPLSHKTIGSYPYGTLRLSPSHFNTKKEIKYAIDSINLIINKS
ncbi:MAG: aminotransferase class V-fold PLP-dependent enzyme [Clostridiaceae bacterium]